ncbi:MAG: hypothetical protein SGILL_003897 [Bacillariaceae sp.]
MSSTILYKFRASSTFEALPLPGSAARLFDVKKAIVKANKLDTGSMEFDLSVRNADTNEEYANESMLLPRGTRLIVQRLPAARGHGFLARMARNEHAGGAVGLAGAAANQQHPSGYYTIDSRARDEDEFVSSSTPAAAENNEERELAALQAATSIQSSGPTMTGTALPGRRGPPQPAGMGGPPQGHKPNFHKPMGQSRPNADPELRAQEQELQPKKTDGNKEGAEQQTSLLQPNKIGFEELINRGGGQSENSARAKTLDYALKITSTTVPEHLQCAICHNVVKNAMLLPWDPEGRTVCESCIRDALTQNGFRCPLTGMDGVSPDDLIPNVGLRKAADMFIKGVMEKVEEIEKQQVEEEETTTEDVTAQSSESNILNGVGVEKGVIVSKRMSLSSRKKSDDDDPFGGGDLFGGDVFAVAKPQAAEEAENPEQSKKDEVMQAESSDKGGDTGTEANKEETKEDTEKTSASRNDTENGNESKDMTVSTQSTSTYQSNKNDNSPSAEAASGEKPPESPAVSNAPPPRRHRRDYRRRGPPTGYGTGPAGGAVVSARATHDQPPPNDDRSHDSDGHGRSGGRGGFSPRGGGGGRFNGRGGRGFGRGGPGPGRGGRGGYDGGDQHHQHDDDDNSRGTKRSWDDQHHDGGGQRWEQQRFDDRGGRGGFRGGPPGRGGRGFRDHGGRGGRWGGQRGGGGRGFRGRGRGRY